MIFDICLGRQRSARAEQKLPILWKTRSATWFIIMVVMFAVYTDIFLYGVVVPVIPFALSDRAGIAQDDVQHWVSVLLAVYGAALCAGSPLCGWFADNVKARRTPLLMGLLALAGATVMLCVGTSLAILMAGRVLQGLSAAVVWTVGLALMVDTVGKRDIGQAMGWVSLAMTLATLTAPMLGGVVYGHGGYYAVFSMAFALIVFDALLRLVMIERKFVAGLEEGQCRTSPVPDPHVPVSPPVPVLAPSRSRLPPVLTLLSSRRLLIALWGCLVQALLMTSFDSVLPLYCQATFGWTSIGAGLIFFALFIPSFSAPAVGYLSDRYGPRWLATSGLVLGLPFYTLLRFVTHDSMQQKVLLCALLALIGVTLTLVLVPLLAEVTHVAESKERTQSFKSGAYAQAYGLFNTAFAAGNLLGPLWAGLVSAKAGWSTMAWTLGLLSGVSAIPVGIFTSGVINKHKTQATGSEDTEAV